MHCVKQNPISSNQLDFALYETVLLFNQTNLLYRFVDKVISISVTGNISPHECWKFAKMVERVMVRSYGQNF